MNFLLIGLTAFIIGFLPVNAACPIILGSNLPTAEGVDRSRPTREVSKNDSTLSPTSRVVNGVAPTGELRRYIVRIAFGGDVGCTGTIINDKYVLTAAHCVGDESKPGGVDASPDGIEVQFYDFNTNDYSIRYDVLKVIPHPGFKQEAVRRSNDIMLLQLDGTAPTSAAIVTVNTNPNIPAPNAYARGAGVGSTSDELSDIGILRQVDVPTRTHESCVDLEPTYVKAMHICAAYMCGKCDTCNGDSGGPLFQFDEDGYVYQIGVAAYAEDGTCARPGMPGVYTRVSNYRQWILSSIAESGEEIFEKGTVRQTIADPQTCPDV